MPLSKHHVPPRCYHEPDTFEIKIPKFKHAAYHKLLGIPPSFDEARRRLAERRNEYLEGRLSEDLMFHFKTLFVKATLPMEDIEQELLVTWWTRRPKRPRQK